MAAPSTLLVLILTYLQVNTIFNANGLTLPLQTVTTKCESVIKGPQKPNLECAIKDKLTLTRDSLSPDISSLSPQEPCARPIANSIGNSPFERLYTTPIIPKEDFTSNVCPDSLLNVINSLSLSDCTINSLVPNSKPLGLNLPVTVSSFINPLPPANLISSDCLNSCNKISASNLNSILDDCVQTPVNSLTLPDQDSLAPGLSCNSKPYGGFKSSFTVSSITNCESRNVKALNSQAPIALEAAQSKTPNMLSQPELFAPAFALDAVSKCENPNLLVQSDTLVPVSSSNNLPLQTCPLNNMGSTTPNLATSGISSCNLSPNIPIGCSNIDQIGNLSPSALPNTCNYSPLIPVPYSNPGLESTASPTIICANKLPATLNPPILSALNLIASGLTSQLASTCSSENPNVINKSKDCTIPSSLNPQQTDMFCPLSSPTNCVQNSAPFIENSFVGPFCNYQTQLPLCPDISLIPIQDSNVCPNNQMYPQSDYSILSQLNPLLDPKQTMTNGNPVLPNGSPLSSNQISPINKYFEDVRAVTAKLNDFAASFSKKLASKNIPKLQSFVAPSQMPSLQPNCMSFEENFEPTPLISCSRPVPIQTPLLQPNIPCEVPVASKYPTIATISSCVENTASLEPPPVVPVTFKAPIVPKTIVSTFNFPICPSPESCNLQDNIASLSSSDYSPFPYFPRAVSSNLFLNLGSYNNLPDAPLIPTSLPAMPSFRPKSLPSVNRSLLNPSLPNPIMNTNEDITSIFMPDLLSSILPKRSCGCDTLCKKPFPYISSISINTLPDCEQVADSCVAPSSLNECTFDSLTSSLLSSPMASFLSPEPTLNESHLDLCCKNLENVISLLESSMYFNTDVDCDFDSLSDILSCL